MDEGVAGTVVEAEPAAAIAPVTGTATVAASGRMGRRALRVMSVQRAPPRVGPPPLVADRHTCPPVPPRYKRGQTPRGGQAVMRKPAARRAGQTVPKAKRRP